MLAQCSSSSYPKFLASLHINNTNPSTAHKARPLQLQKQRIMKSDIYEDQLETGAKLGFLLREGDRPRRPPVAPPLSRDASLRQRYHPPPLIHPVKWAWATFHRWIKNRWSGHRIPFPHSSLCLVSTGDRRVGDRNLRGGAIFAQGGDRPQCGQPPTLGLHWLRPWLESLCLRHSDRLSQVRRMFDQTRGEKETLLFIDSLQKLAIDYHFEEEIQAKMHSLYDQRLTISNGEPSSIREVTLLFRLLRQARYPVSTDVLHRFHDGRGEFMASLSKEMNGLMSLFEASNLNTGGELILYRAKEFSSHHLRSYMASLGPEFAVAIEQVLEAPSHMTLQRFRARQYFDSDNFYHNLNVRELGEMDFTMLQSLHQKELKEVTSWWKKSGLGQELGFARDQSLKWFTWTMTCLPNPKFSSYRVVLSKIITFVYLLDDIFDVEGSMDDLHLFVHAIERWDHSSMDSLPNYMRSCFKALNNTINEIAEIVFKEHGWNPIEYLKKSWIQLSKAFLVEAKWLSKDQVPTMDDYMKIATITCGVPTALMHMYFILGHRINDDLCEDIPSLISCPARILRLWDDLGSAKDEQQNGRDGSLLVCMMKENPHWSLEFAKEKVMQMIDEEWEELNKESFGSSTSMFSQDFVRACLNSARMVRVMYNYNEEHNLPMLKEYINLLLFK